MTTSQFEIEIQASIEEVWFALTNSEAFNSWMKNVRVETDWKQGADITYTCYDERGAVLQWNGMDMIWQGNIKTINMNKELTCVYPSQRTGLVEESYLLEKMDADKTKLRQLQTFISKEVADGYGEGTAMTLELLKNHLKKNKI